MNYAQALRSLIIGDVVGSVLEGALVSDEPYPLTRVIGNRFSTPRGDRTGEVVATMPLIFPGCTATDDSILSCAVSEYLLDLDAMAPLLQKWFHMFPRSGYGKGFVKWASTKNPQNGSSWGNGVAMRVGAIIDWTDDPYEAMRLAQATALPTHGHIEAVNGAKAIVLAGVALKNGASKQQVTALCEKYGLVEPGRLSCALDDLRPSLKFSSKAVDTVPLALQAFIESGTFEETLRRALSLGGDTDTIAAMACAVASQRWSPPESLWLQVEALLPEEVLACLARFEKNLS